MAGLREAADDLARGWGRRELWSALALQDIRSRYRRSVLGPFWISVQMLAFVLGVGFLYSALFAIPSKSFIPFVALGYLMWSFLSGALLEGSRAFVSMSHFIRSSTPPLTTYAYRSTAVQGMVFAHSAAVVLVMLVVLRVAPVPSALWAVPTVVALAFLNGFLAVLWLGPLAARYRDITPLLTTVLQLLLFLTPIF